MFLGFCGVVLKQMQAVITKGGTRSGGSISNVAAG